MPLETVVLRVDEFTQMETLFIRKPIGKYPRKDKIYGTRNLGSLSQLNRLTRLQLVGSW